MPPLVVMKPQCLYREALQQLNVMAPFRDQNRPGVRSDRMALCAIGSGSDQSQGGDGTCVVDHNGDDVFLSMLE